MTEVQVMSMLETKQALSVYFSPLAHRYTLEEFWALPEPEGRAHYDLIGRYLFMVPPPDPPHGDIDARLAALLHEFIRSNAIAGEVHHPREAIYLNQFSDTYIEPD